MRSARLPIRAPLSVADHTAPLLKVVEHRGRCIASDTPASNESIAAPSRLTAHAIRAKVARGEEEIDAARRLIEERYSWRGYKPTRPNGVEKQHSINSHNRLMLIARQAGELVGTLTIGFDSRLGLLAERTHTQAVQALRSDGRVICELTRLALRKRARSKWVLATLFELAYLVGRVGRGVTDVVVEVNPRHVAYYRRVFGFVVSGPARTCPRVNAPSVLMRLEVSDLERRFREYFDSEGTLGA